MTTLVHSANWCTSTIFCGFKSWLCCFWNHVVVNCLDRTHIFHYMDCSIQCMWYWFRKHALVYQILKLMRAEIYTEIPNSWRHAHLPYISRTVVRVGSVLVWFPNCFHVLNVDQSVSFRCILRVLWMFRCPQGRPIGFMYTCR